MTYLKREIITGKDYIDSYKKQLENINSDIVVVENSDLKSGKLQLIRSLKTQKKNLFEEAKTDIEQLLKYYMEFLGYDVERDMEQLYPILELLYDLNNPKKEQNVKQETTTE